MTDTLSAAKLAAEASRGPRYTSYPPATEFAPLDGEAVLRELDLVAALGEATSLYVHIPFCRSLCWYCGCNVVPTRDTNAGAKYVEHLADEASLVGSWLGHAPVTEIALGGGSPNFLSPASLRKLFAALSSRFEIAPDARRSIELDPRTTTSEQLETLAAARFRSLSVGVQDFSEAVQDAIHRHQSTAQTRWLIESARSLGFDDVNVDVVYGLPCQTEASFARTIEAVIDLAPERIALFGYAHLPDKLPHQRLVERAGRVLVGEERAALFLRAMDQLTSAGYVHVGLDHFAKPSSRLARAADAHQITRSFQGYTERRADTVIGLGMSAISSTPRMHWQNHSELGAWQQAVTSATLPVARGVVLDNDDQVRREVIGRLMCDGEVDLYRIGAEHGLNAPSYFASELDRLARLADLARYDRDTQTVHTTTLGRLLVRNVCQVFDRYQRPTASADAEPRFSPTI
ncbi:MAG TPA: oxygen-independent coproporphyrinogen III oxidase [Kofleriaceae bacterium]|nr:oxygen-independent coproporphyrinogen III oxidase [Kofleriaceae bacterium]